jgi:hypothetical protein
MIKGVSTKAQSNGFQWNYFSRADVAQVDIGSEKLDKPNLLGFLRGFPDDFFFRNLG